MTVVFVIMAAISIVLGGGGKSGYTSHINPALNVSRNTHEPEYSARTVPVQPKIAAHVRLNPLCFWGLIRNIMRFGVTCRDRINFASLPSPLEFSVFHRYVVDPNGATGKEFMKKMPSRVHSDLVVWV